MARDQSNIYSQNTLYYNNLGLDTIPKAVFECPKLEKLDLSYNKIKIIPEEIKKLERLRYLDFSNNQLQTIPNGLAKLQALEVLILSNNQLTAFLPVLTQLPKLKVLKLKGNQIQALPDQINALKALVVLDLGFNPLKKLPLTMGELKGLKWLVCTSNHFDIFPEVLLELEQLEQIEKLDLAFRLKLPNSKLELLFKVLRHLKKQKASLEVKKAAFGILFTPNYKGAIANVLPLLLVNYVAFSQAVRAYLINTCAGQLNERSKIAILGKTAWMDLDALEPASISTVVTAATTHIVLGKSITKQMLTSLHDQLFFVSERTALAFLSPKQPTNWLEEHRDKILNLLRSGQNENIALAIQLAKDNALLDDMLTELLMAYTQITAGNTSLRNDLKALFYRRIPNFEQITLPSASFKFYTPNKSEHAIFQGIKNITSQTDAWEGLKIAHYLFDKHGVAYTYLLAYLGEEETQIWLEQFINQNTIVLGRLSKLKELPQSLPAFSHLSKLDLRGCGFRTFPAIDILEQLPHLEEIDLRDNPISFVPRNLFAAVSKYRILLSK